MSGINASYWGLGSYKTGGHPAFYRDDKGIQHFEEVGLQALSPVTLMITHYSPIFLISFANIQLIIDIDKEKGIYLFKNPFFLQYRSFLKDQKQFAWLYQNPFLNKKGEFLTFFGAKKVAKKHPPSPRPLPIWRGCNRSACRSYTMVSSDHQRSGLSFLSTTLNAGR